jgi:hypothetical protein
VLGAVAGGDVILGHQRDEVGAALDRNDLLGLAFGDCLTERILGDRTVFRSGVHGTILCRVKGDPTR